MYVPCPAFYMSAERSGCCNKGKKMSLPAMSDASRRAFPSTSATYRSERSTITNAVGTRSRSDNTQAVIGQANADAKELCMTCHEPISLSERSVKLPACRHVFHNDCYRSWIQLIHRLITTLCVPPVLCQLQGLTLHGMTRLILTCIELPKRTCSGQSR